MSETSGPLLERFKPELRIARSVGQNKIPNLASHYLVDWRERVDSPLGRTHGELAELYGYHDIDYFSEWRDCIASAVAEGEMWVVDIGSACGVLGLELAAIDNGEKVMRPERPVILLTGKIVTIGPEEDIVARRIVEFTREKGVKIKYIGITELPAVGDGQEPWMEKTVFGYASSDYIEAVNIVYTLDYQGKPKRTLREIMEDFGGIKIKIFIAHSSLDKKLRGQEEILLDIAGAVASRGLFLASPIKPNEKAQDIIETLVREGKAVRKGSPNRLVVALKFGK